MVGRVLPPHLSPFVDNEAEGYVPEYAETIARLQAGARKEILPMPGVGQDDLDDPQNLLVEGVIDRAEAIEAAERKRKMSILEKQYHDELKSELEGTLDSSVSNASKENTAEDTDAISLKQLTEDDNKMSQILMSRKKRKLLEAMEISIGRKKDTVDRLQERKKKIDESSKLKST